MSRAKKVIFTISILGNLFLIGIVGGHIYKSSAPKLEAWKELRKDLSPETRDLVRQKFRESRKGVAEIVRDIRQKKKELETIIIAEEFSPEEYDRVAGELSTLGLSVAEHKLQMFKELAMELSQEERVKVSKKIASAVVGRHGGKKHKYKKAHDYKEGREKDVSKPENGGEIKE